MVLVGHVFNLGLQVATSKHTLKDVDLNLTRIRTKLLHAIYWTEYSMQLYSVHSGPSSCAAR